MNQPKSPSASTHPREATILTSPPKDSQSVSSPLIEPSSVSKCPQSIAMARVNKHLLAIIKGRKHISCFANVTYWLGLLLFLVFAFAYVGLLQLYVLRGQVFPSKTANIGYYIHAFTGLVYFAIGFAQFSSTLRTRFPTLHRWLGWVYSILSLATTIGIVAILVGGSHAKESSVIATITGVPLWFALQVSAILAIRRGDVALHRRQQLRAFVLSFSIVFMRPGVMLLNIFVQVPDDRVGDLLKTVLWWVFVWAVLFTETYLVKRRSAFDVPSSVAMLPSSAAPSGDQQDVFVTSAHHLDPASGSIVSDLAQGAQWTPARLEHSEFLNPTTVRLVFSCASIHPSMSAFPWTVVPGQHIALSCTATLTPNGTRTTVVRSYSPTSSPTAVANRQIELFVRLVPGGAMSSLIERVANPEPSVPPMDAHWQVAFSQTIVPYVPQLHSYLVVVAAGTGITPLWNLACTAVACGTRVHLVHVQTSEGQVFFERKVGEMTRATTDEGKGGKVGAQGRLTYAKVFTDCYELGKSADVHSQEGMVHLVKEAIASVHDNEAREWDRTGLFVVGCGPPSFGRHVIRACQSSRGKKELGLDADQVLWLAYLTGKA